MFKEDRD
jgi:hypothetical protein